MGEHVPGGQRPEVVVAGQPGGRGVEQLGDGAVQDLGGPPGPAEPVVEPRGVHGGLVAQVRVRGVVHAGVQFGEEGVELRRHRLGAAALLDERARVVRHQPAVLVTGGLLELRAAFPEVERAVEAVAVPRPDLARLRVEEVAPVLRPCHERGVRLAVAEPPGELGDGEVVDRVLERLGGRRAVVAALHPAQAGVLVEELAVAAVRGQRLGVDHRTQRGLPVVVGAAERVGGGQDRLEAVAAHLLLRDAVVRPVRPAPGLGDEVGDRLVDVRADLGEQQRDQLCVPPVAVPAGVCRVLVTALRHPADRSVVAQVLAVDVVVGVGVQQGVVERGVEAGALFGGAAGHLQGAERLAPGVRRGLPDGGGRAAGGLGRGVLRRVLDADVGDADPGRDLGAAGEADERAGSVGGVRGCLGGARGDPGTAPRPGGVELGVEFGGEVDAVGAAAAHRGGLGPAGDRVPRHGHLASGGAVVGTGHVEDQGRGGPVRGEVEGGDAGAGRRGERHVDAVVQADGVVAGLGGLVVVREVQVVVADGVGRRGGQGPVAGQFAGVGQDRHVERAVAARAARAGEPGQAEAAQLVGAVLVAAPVVTAGRVMRGGGELHHAERNGRARPRVAVGAVALVLRGVVPGADELVHGVVRAQVRRGPLGARGGHGGHAGARQQARRDQEGRGPAARPGTRAHRASRLPVSRCVPEPEMSPACTSVEHGASSLPCVPRTGDQCVHRIHGPSVTVSGTGERVTTAP